MQIQSSDLYESSYLYCIGARLIDITLNKRSFRPTAIFTFEGDHDLKQRQNDFHIGEAMVNIADYRRSLVELKRLMFNIIDGNPPQFQQQNRSPLHTKITN